MCANFNYNAFSVMLLARAYEVSGEKKYLDAAIRKWRVGLQPGQVSSGRWVDAHNAKTVYHLIILRGLHELLAVLPAEAAERAELMAQCVRAVKPVVEEIEAMGVTNSSMLLGQLVRHAELCGASNASLARAAEQVASLAFERSVEEREGSFSGKQTAVTPGELAVMWRVWGTHGASPAGK